MKGRSGDPKGQIGTDGEGLSMWLLRTDADLIEYNQNII